MVNKRMVTKFEGIGVYSLGNININNYTSEEWNSIVEDARLNFEKKVNSIVSDEVTITKFSITIEDEEESS